MANVFPIKGSREAPKSLRSTMDTLIFSANEIEGWLIPPFQRPLRVNEKVRALSEALKGEPGICCTLPGIITLGRLPADKTLWLVDGQHRKEGFKLSGKLEGLADVRICNFESMADMADEFVNLNSSLVKMKPDDILRGLEASAPALKYIREQCEFVGYDQIRRNSSTAPVLSMSVLLRCWATSAGDTPGGANRHVPSHQLAATLDRHGAEQVVVFLLAARAAWGGDIEYARLWSGLNLTICMWLWRRLVLEEERGIKRFVKLTPEQFRKCLMSVSATGEYVDWLRGRAMGDRDRSPCYGRLKAIFANRLLDDSKDKKKPMMPSPAWASK